MRRISGIVILLVLIILIITIPPTSFVYLVIDLAIGLGVIFLVLAIHSIQTYYGPYRSIFIMSLLIICLILLGIAYLVYVNYG